MSYTCDNCMKKIEGTVTFCQDCGKYMCTDCSTTIHSFKAFRDHEPEPLEASSTAASSLDSDSSEFCSHHKDVCARLFCEDCKELCCYHCICDGGKHSQHKVVLSRDAYEQKKTSVSKGTSQLENFLQALDTEKGLLESEVTGCRRSKEELDKEIDSKMGEIQEKLRGRAAELEKSVTENDEKMKKDFTDIISGVKKLMADADGAIGRVGNGEADFLGKKFAVIKESGIIEKTTEELISGNKTILERIDGLAENVEFSAKANSSLNSADSMEKLGFEIGKFGTVVDKYRDVKIKNSKLEIKITMIKEKSEEVKKEESEEVKKEETEEVKKEETEEVKKEETKKAKKVTKKNIKIKWDKTICKVLRDIVELGGDDIVYTLEGISWNGKKAEKPSKYTILYQGKATEYEIPVFTEPVGEARLSIGDPTGIYRLWESKSQNFGGIYGTYDGVFLDSDNVTFLGEEHRVVERKRDGRSHATVVADTPLMMGDVNVFNLFLHETDAGNNGMSVGVAPTDIDTDPSNENREECGWYLNLYETKLYSGPPQRYRGKAYGRRNDVSAGDIIRVTFDTTGTTGVLSFAINDVDLGVAYDDIPLNKPIAPAVYFYGRGECVELCGFDFAAPEKWSLELDGDDISRLPEETVWKECPSVSKSSLKYTLPETSNLRIAKKTDVSGSIYSTMVTNIPVPIGAKYYWSIGIVSAFGSDGNEVFTGVAPSDISHEEIKNYKVCGWYLRWGRGSLYSGPPQNYHNKSYSRSQGASKKSNIGHILDTTGTTAKLSFIVQNKDAGVAYDDIPLDKPLVPCVLLHFAGDTVELFI